MSDTMMGIIFSNMHDDFLSDLTMNRTTASVPFGGRYRLIDFTLSNMVNSDIDQIGIIAKSNYHSLMDHVGSGKEWDLARKRGGLTILPPFARSGSGVYRGNLDALSGIISYLRHNTAKYVVMSDCCAVCNVNLRAVLEEHKRRGAGITLLYSPGQVITSPRDQVGIVTDSKSMLSELVINPAKGSIQNCYENIAIVDRELLIHKVIHAVSQNKYSFVQDILTQMANTDSVYCHPISGSVLEVHDLKSFFDSNMRLLDGKVRSELFNPERPVYTKVRDEVPAKYGLSATVQNSLVADGCIIDGQVKNSIIFRGVHIGKGARIENCIIMQSTVIEDNVELDYVITDKDVVIRGNRKLAGYLTYPMFVPKGQQI